MEFLYVFGALGAIIVIGIIRSIRIVPSKSVIIVERLGKYRKTLEAGINFNLPFIDRFPYKHSLKEVAIDVPAQDCFTKDNVKVKVDGVLYMQVVDPVKASYGISNFKYATIQIAQTTMRSVIGKLELDKTFEERTMINAEVVRYVDAASDPWGIKVSRYEIQNISVPNAIIQAMEIQMKSEREKRADIAKSEGDMTSRINRSVGLMEEQINKSEGIKEKLVNEAEGQAAQIRAISKATAAGIRALSDAIGDAGGEEAMILQLTENYLQELGKLAKSNTELILPMNLNDVTVISKQFKEILDK
jgi:regulator of protease activity HflC (stomatin/prohibitin superfamily)